MNAGKAKEIALNSQYGEEDASELREVFESIKESAEIGQFNTYYYGPLTQDNVLDLRVLGYSVLEVDIEVHYIQWE